MRIAEIVGRVTLSRAHPNLKPGRWLIALPMTRDAIVEGAASRGEDVVAFDDLGAGPGSIVGLSEGREAANPFGKTKVPIDAYVACLIDHIDV
jgi:ethanolamine utilization protein EutN